MAIDESVPDAPVPMLLVSGFLGSGKTTLINRWLRLPAALSGMRLGVLVNEFGQIGLDGALLGPGDVVELEGGCVCCASGRELWEAADGLRGRADVTHLVVETSGIAEPGVLLAQYADLPPELGARFDLRGLLCLVDGMALEQALSRRAEARSQIAGADRLLISKLDLCGAEERAGRLAAVHARLDREGGSAERAVILPQAPEGEVAQVLRWAMALGRAGRGREHGHDHVHGAQLCAVSVQERGAVLLGPLRRLLEDLPGGVLRAKGVVRGIGEDGTEAICVLHHAGGRVELRPAREGELGAVPEGSTMVFIGEDLDEGWLRLRLSACRA